jgi:hypothetical protein
LRVRPNAATPAAPARPIITADLTDAGRALLSGGKPLVAFAELITGGPTGHTTTQFLRAVVRRE